jgi:thiol-disulfide isomerase/thioredoxin
MNGVRRMAGAIAVIALAVGIAGCSGAGGSVASGSALAVAPAPSGIAVAPTVAPPAATPAATATTTANGTATWLYDPNRDARADVIAAIAAAKADGKLVLVDFGADWCPDCHVLAAYMDRPAAKAIVDASFHVVAVDVGTWDHNLDVAASYGDAIWGGIPALVVLDGDGKVLRSTADGSVASAASMSEEQVLAILRALAQ